MLVAVLAGLPAGALVGTLSQLLMGLLTGYQYLPFVVIQWLLALLVAVATRRRGFSSLGRTIAWGLAVRALLRRGLGRDLVPALPRRHRRRRRLGHRRACAPLGYPLPIAVAIGSGSTDVLDKRHRDRGRRRAAARAAAAGSSAASRWPPAPSRDDVAGRAARIRSPPAPWRWR